MGIYLNPGNESFQQTLISEIYVDKSLLIEHTNRVLHTNQKYICVSRPRRFGKTMALEMLSAYYSRGCDSRETFQNLKIAETSGFEKHLNQYNVIHLNMVNFLNRTEPATQMVELITKAVGRELQKAFPDVDFFDTTMLDFMLDDIYDSCNVQFVFLIDEWDCIFRLLPQDKEAQKLYLDFLCNLLKDRSYVALAYVTGILPVKMSGHYTSVDFTEISMLDVHEFAEVTGFTETEVAALCKKYSMSFDDAQCWYEGYHLNGITIYNPLTVVEAMLRGRYGNYWAKTETHKALQVYLEANHEGLRNRVVQLIAGERVVINPTKFRNDMVSFRCADDVLTLLVHLGYLTYDFDTKQVWIPNGEVRQEFINCIGDNGWEQD